MKKSIEDHMVDIMNENSEYEVDIGIPVLWTECFYRSEMKPSKNTLRNGYRVMDALDRSAKFNKKYIRYQRTVRVFELKQEYRNKKYNCVK